MDDEIVDLARPAATLDPESISTRAEFAAGLTALRERAGLTVRDLARRLGVPAATLGGYFSGRHLPTVSQVPKLTELLVACGVASRTDIDAWLSALSRCRGHGPRAAVKPPAPYRGLEAFEPDDADLFFGRDAETADVIDRLGALAADPGPSRGVLAVLGPSGSGKSSLLRAGVVAAVRAGALDGGGVHWACDLATPGPDPLTTLGAALSELGAVPADPTGSDRRVLVVDQFEELFTSGADPAVRGEVLRRLADRPAGVLLVIGMRADFYATAATEPFLLAALQHAQVLVGPLGVKQVREAILRPAAAAGVEVDDGLVDLVLADLAPHDAAGFAHDAGALPLLSHALLSTWERATGTRLTIADYRDAGGIDTAVQRTAEDLFTSLAPDEQDLARRVFLRLVNIDDEVAVTRRRANRDELSRLTDGLVDTDGPADADALVDAFVERRLLTAHASSVEISHEALLSAWPRLRSWVDADRAGLRVHRRITESATMWLDGGEDPSLLLRGVRLEAATEWAADDGHRGELDPLERRYLDVSTQRAAFDRTRERRRSRRLRRLLAVAAVLAVAAGVLAFVAARATSGARAARDDALSREVAGQAVGLEARDPALAEQLAVAAYRIAPTGAARGALIQQSATPPITRILGAQGPTPLALSADGTLIAVSHADDGTVHLYAVHGSRTPTPVGVLPGSAQQIYALAISPSGTQLATGGTGHAVQLWDIRTPNAPRSEGALYPRFSQAVESLAFSPDGTSLVAGGGDKKHAVIRWDITTPTQPVQSPVPTAATGLQVVQSVAFSPEGSYIAATGRNGEVVVWRAATPASPVTRSLMAGDTIDVARFMPGGARLLVGDSEGQLYELDTSTLKTLTTRTSASNSQIYSLAISTDGRHIAFGRSDSTVTETDAGLQSTDFTSPNEGPVTGVAFSPDGSTLYSTDADGTLRIVQPSADVIAAVSTVFSLSTSPHGHDLAVIDNGGRSGGIRLWNVSNRMQPEAYGPRFGVPGASLGGSGQLNPAGTLLAAGESNGSLALFDVTNRVHPRLVGAPFHAATATIECVMFSPNGRIVAVASDDGTVSLTSVADAAAPRRLGVLHVNGFAFGDAFSPDGKVMATGDSSGAVKLWDIADPTHPHMLSTLSRFGNYVYSVAFSPDGRTLAAASADHTARLWRITDPRHPSRIGSPLVGSTDYLYWVAFSPNGKTLATASNDQQVRLYDVRSGSPVPSETLGGLDAPIFALAFSPDGRTLYAAGRSESVSAWSLDPVRYARSLCTLVGTPITRTEWSLYVPGAAYDPPCRSSGSR